MALQNNSLICNAQNAILKSMLNIPLKCGKENYKFCFLFLFFFFLMCSKSGEKRKKKDKNENHVISGHFEKKKKKSLFATFFCLTYLFAIISPSKRSPFGRGILSRIAKCCSRHLETKNWILT